MEHVESLRADDAPRSRAAPPNQSLAARVGRRHARRPPAVASMARRSAEDESPAHTTVFRFSVLHVSVRSAGSPGRAGSDLHDGGRCTTAPHGGTAAMRRAALSGRMQPAGLGGRSLAIRAVESARALSRRERQASENLSSMPTGLASGRQTEWSSCRHCARRPPIRAGSGRASRRRQLLGAGRRADRRGQRAWILGG